jgi:hypothetical protein
MPQKKNDFPKGGDKMITPTILPQGTTSLEKKWLSCLPNNFLLEEISSMLKIYIQRLTLFKSNILYTIGKLSKCRYQKWNCIFNLTLQAQNYSKKKTKNQNFKSHCSSRQLEKNFKTFCSLDMLNLFLVFLC